MPDLSTQKTLSPSKPAWIAAGFVFAVLWASASTATKIGLSSAQPLVIAEVRFGTASALMLVMAHLFKRHRLPAGKEWRELAIYGFLNITLYLGLYVVAMQGITAGIGALSVATNPIFISLLSAIVLKKQPGRNVILALLICSLGVLCAAWPLLRGATMSGGGLWLLLASMLSYSAATLYYSSRSFNGLHLFVVNGWQTLFGGLFLLPVALIFYHPSKNHFSISFWSAVLWLAIPVSVFAIQLWLWLLRIDAVKASLWLFLCPVFGYAIAAWLVGDAISLYTIAGVLLVVGGLFLAQKRKPE